MKKPFYLLFIGLLLISVANNLQANNIAVSKTELANQNSTDDYTLVQFDLSWENSWRTSSAPNNWDAAWVFVKYRVGTGEWQHARLNNTGHSGGTGTGASNETTNTNDANAVFGFQTDVEGPMQPYYSPQILNNS